MTDMKKILILPLLLFFLVQGSMAQTPKWVEKAKRAVFSIVTYDKNDKMLNNGKRILCIRRRIGFIRLYSF